MTIQVQGITVRFRRTIQVTQYEPAEAEVTLVAVAPEGEAADTAKDTASLLKIAAEEVHESLGLPRNTRMPARAKATGTKREAGSEIPGSVATHGNTRSEGGKTTPVTVAGAAPANAGDIPETPSAPAAQPQAAAQSTAGDIPDGPAPAPAKPAAAPAQPAQPAAPAPTADDAAKTKALSNLSAWIGDFVKAGAITAAEVKTIYPKYGIASVNNLRAEQKEPFYHDVLALLKAKEDAASL